ncbi:MAG TPA: DNA recombination protein RmuC, partial [Candidatus Cloacimonadota bacterium]|nr:DNA recombination protein RmuC [Candidatus Cloacimonadota bacterium]
QMEDIRSANEKKLEEMRHTVDEKLQQTLETRLGESFRQVSERLEQVHQSLGEMKNLANGVGDLKKVLQNVSTRGAMGELQLENIISQLLTPEQYEKQFKPRPRSPEVVEFAIRLPGKDESERPVFMPIDSKFPLEDYHALVMAYESGDAAGIDSYRKALINRIKSCARDIRDKYINPPNTTDFALLFLPIEGLFAEALRDPGVFETIQREMHVILTGPTTLAAILNSLQLGFRSLAIEKRSSEVWRTLSAVKTQFGKFGGLLDKTRKKIDEASKSLGEATDSTRRIERKLQGVQELPTSEAISLLGIDSETDQEEVETEV